MIDASKYYFSPSALTVTPNMATGKFTRSEVLEVSVAAGAAIKVANQLVTKANRTLNLGYNAQLGYRQFIFRGYNTVLGHPGDEYIEVPVYVYIRLDAGNNGSTGELVFLPYEVDYDGRLLLAEGSSPVIYESIPLETHTDQQGNTYYTLPNTNSESDSGLFYYYIHIASLSAPENGQRAWTVNLQTGQLETAKGNDEKQDPVLDKMFRLVNNVINVLLPFDKLSFSKSGSAFVERILATTSESIDDFATWAQQHALATTASIASYVSARLKILDDRYFRKDQPDTDPHLATFGNLHIASGLDKGDGTTSDGNLEVDGDAQVNGNASVEGNLNVSGNTTIGSGVTDEALVNAIMSVLSQMKSTNYTDDSPIGKGGWNLLSADANGNSYLVIDKLFVRLKAIFNELEIRKISYAGGNIIFSHAGSVIVEVKPLYRDGVIYAYRCYFKKDDGTTATENWWKVDDQAKCQTFNVEEGVHQNVKNTYYWRQVVAVGSERVTISDTTSEEEYNYADLSLSDCDANSDIPKAGDSIVQMGNRTRTDRQGFVIIEVYGPDAPCLKIYDGINSYVLSEGQCPLVLSPKRRKIIANELLEQTSYGTFRQMKERGEWDDIPNHRCYYFDRVQHDGSSWLCTYPEGATPEYTTEEPSLTATYWRLDAKAGEPAPSYTQEWYAWSNVQSVASATTEPTPHSGWQNTITSQGNYAYLWRKIQKFVWNATTRVYVAETAQYFRMSGTNGTSISVKGTVATVANLPTTHNDGDAYVVEADRHLYMWSDESNRWLDIGEFKGEDGKTYYTHIAWATNVTYNSTTGEVTNVEGFTIAKSPDDTTHYWMGVYVDENSAADPSDAMLYTWSYTKGIDGTPVYFADIDNEMDAVACNHDGTVASAQTVSTNVSLHEGSAKLESPTIKVYDGTTSGTQYTSGTARDGITVTWSAAALVSVLFSTAASIDGKKVFCIQLSKNGVTREVYFTVNGMRAALDGTPATIYNIKPSVPQIVTGRDEEGFNPKTFTLRCGYTKNTGGDMTVVEDVTGKIDGTYNLYFRQHIRVGAQPTTTLYPDGIWQTTWRLYTTYKEHATNTSTLTDVLVRNADAIEFILCTATANSVADADLGNYTVIDRETVPVVSDGAKAVPPMTETVTSQWALSDNGDTPPASGWVSERPVPTQAQRYLWQRDVHTFTADDYGRNWFTGSEDLDIVPNASSFSSRANKKGYFTGSGGTVERDTTQELPLPELKSCVKIYSSNTSAVGFAQQRVTLESGRSMVLSFWAKGEVDGQTMSNRVLYNQSGKEQSPTVTVNLTTQWQRYHMVAVVPETERPDAWSYAFLRTAQADSTIYVCGVKLEYGSGMPTDWCKAPEDCDYTETKVVEVGGLDGSSPYFLDIDNEMHSVACASDGKPTASGSKTVNVKMWKGSTELTPTVTCTPVSQTGVTSTPAGQAVTFSWATGTAIGVNNSWIITAVADGVTLTTTFVLNGVRAGVTGGKGDKGDDAVIYELIPYVNQIVKKKSGAYVPSADTYITCDVTKNVGGSQSTPATSEYTLKYKLNGGAETTYTASSVKASDVTSSLQFILYDKSGNKIDVETIPLVSDGTDGVSPYYIKADSYVISIPCGSDGKPLESKTYSVNVVFMQAGISALYDYAGLTKKSGTGVTGQFVSVNPQKVQFTVNANTAISDNSRYELEYEVDDVSYYAYFDVNAVKPGASGTPAADVTLSQYAVVFQQSEVAQSGVYPVDMTGNTTLVKAVSGNTPVKPTAISLNPVNCNVTFGTNASDYNNSTIGTPSAGTYVKIQSVLTHTVDGKTVPHEQGYVDINVTVNGTVFVKRFSFAVNLLGQWKERTMGDVNKAIAQSTTYTVNGQSYTVKDNLGEYIRSSTQNISTLQTTVGDENGGLVKQMTTFEQTTQNISMKVSGMDYMHNLLPNPIFLKGSPFTSWRSVTGLTYSKTLYDGKTQSIAQGVTLTSPWYFDGGKFLTLHVSGNSMSSNQWIYPSGVASLQRIKLMPNKTYTFSVWVNISGNTSGITQTTICRATTYNAATGGTATSRNVGATAAGTIGEWTQYYVTFTTDSTSIYFVWYPYVPIKAGETFIFISYAGVKLMLENNPSPMSYDINPKKLLDTGIDIEERKIKARADMFIAENNAGEKTAWLDQYGNWTTRGVQANLITVIDWDNDRGRELLIPSRPTNDPAADDEYEPLPLGGTYSGTPPNIKYTVNGTTYDVSYIDIDVLRCGNMVVIKSLPVYGEGASSNRMDYNIPYCLTSNKALWSQHRGATMFETGIPHKLTGNELRMLVGKTITFKFDIPNIGNRRYYTRIYGMKLLTPATGYSTVQNAAQDTIYYQYPTSDTNINQDFWMLNQVGHITFKHVMWVGSGVRGSGFCWVGKQLSNSSDDDIEDVLDGSDWND